MTNTKQLQTMRICETFRMCFPDFNFKKDDFESFSFFAIACDETRVQIEFLCRSFLES